jgi:DNA-directed RNA polymerase subunit H (RpoH/RPB5)
MDCKKKMSRRPFFQQERAVRVSLLRKLGLGIEEYPTASHPQPGGRELGKKLGKLIGVRRNF